MLEEFEYKFTHQRRGVWLAAAVIVLMMGIVTQAMLPQLVWAIYLLTLVMLVWMSLGVPVAGIRVTDDALIAAAWREPLALPLIEIAEMRAMDWSEQSDVFVRMLDGSEHILTAGDLPPISVLTDLMMERGVYLRDPA